MKKLLLTTVIIGSILSCGEEKEIGDISFSTNFARSEDSDLYDSVSFIEVSYSNAKEFSSANFDDPNKYSYSIRFDVDKSQRINQHFGTKFIHLAEGQYVIKRFDLLDKNGEVIYYIPYEVPDEYKTDVINTVSTLPIIFGTSEARSIFDFTIIKK